MTKRSIDISKTPVHLGEDEQGAVVLNDFSFDPASFEAYIGKHCGEKPGRILMIETTAADWTTWERHTKGDEIVYVVEGEGQFIQEIDGEQIHIAVKAGDLIINPKGVWHTADVVKPIKALYMTPCPGTEHKAR